MITQTTQIRRSEERGHANHGWLDSYHTFSFANYYDPNHMGFRSLRVINDDRITPGGGFPMHPHKDMEIFSYIVKGIISHEDTMGNRKTLKPGEVQLMSTGSGIKHSEYNPSNEEELHLLQIWLTPNQKGLTPSYTEWKPNGQQKNAKKTLIISPDGQESSAIIHQDANIYRIHLKPGESVTHELSVNRGLWIQVVSGTVSVADELLATGDALSSQDAGTYQMTAKTETEILLFDLK